MVGDDAPIDLAGEEALEASDDIALAEALGGASSDVVDGRLVEAHANDRGAVERHVGFAAATSRQPVTVCKPRGSGDRTGAAELSEQGFGAHAFRVVTEHHQHLGGGVSTDPEPLSQDRSVSVSEFLEDGVVGSDLGIEGLRPLCQGALG